MNVYTIEIVVQDHQQNLHNEAEQHRLAQGEASEKRSTRNLIGESIRHIFSSEPVRVEPTKPTVHSVPARNRG